MLTLRPFPEMLVISLTPLEKQTLVPIPPPPITCCCTQLPVGVQEACSAATHLGKAQLPVAGGIGEASSRGCDAASRTITGGSGMPASLMGFGIPPGGIVPAVPPVPVGPPVPASGGGGTPSSSTPSRG